MMTVQNIINGGKNNYDNNKNILEEIRNKPNAIILLDEIEKAHPLVINLICVGLIIIFISADFKFNRLLNSSPVYSVSFILILLI